MKLTLSALFALSALMPAISAQDLDPHVILTFASNWDSGTLSVNDKFIQISDQNNKIPIDVNGNTGDYRYLAEVEFDKVDKDAWVYFNITQSGARAGSNHCKTAIRGDPGVQWVHILLDGSTDVKVNVFGDEVDLVCNLPSY